MAWDTSNRLPAIIFTFQFDGDIILGSYLISRFQL